MLKIKSNPLKVLYTASFFLSFGVALSSYINSSFLSTLIGQNKIGIVYAVASFVAIWGITMLPKIIRRYGAYSTTIAMCLICIASLLALSRDGGAPALLAVFIIYYAMVAMTFYSFDIFVENYSKDSSTGKTRGTYLAIGNLAWLLTPLIVGRLAEGNVYGGVYLICAICILPVVIVFASRFKRFEDPKYAEISFASAWRAMQKHKSLKNIFKLNFILQFFFSWMVIYTPLYLHQYIGFDWKTIGYIFTFMLLPFILIQIPAGRLADRKYGEREMLIVGLGIAGVATFCVAILGNAGAVVWAAVLFTTRVGAAMTESMSEIYFFKNIGPEDAGLLGLYRNMGPLAYIIAPLLATLFLSIFDIQYLFVFLSLFVLSGIFVAIKLKDTK